VLTTFGTGGASPVQMKARSSASSQNCAGGVSHGYSSNAPSSTGLPFELASALAQPGLADVQLSAGPPAAAVPEGHEEVLEAT